MSYPFMEKKRLFISDSSRGVLHSCARKFEFRKAYAHPKRRTSVAAELGKALHSGWQTYLITKDEDAAIFDYMTKYPIELCDSEMDPRSLEAGYFTLASMINATPLLNYELASIQCLDGVVRPAVEVPFQIDLVGFELPGGVGVSYIGYIDTIFWKRLEDEYVVLDVKSTKRKVQDLTPLYAFDEQCLPYGLVLEYMKGARVTGFEVQYLVANIDILEPNVQLHPFNKSHEDITDWFRGLVIDLGLLKTYLAMEWFPRSGGGQACLAFNTKCDFYDICSVRDPKAIQAMILDVEDKISGEIEQDEAFKSKTLRPEFVPWIKFDLPVEM